MHRKKNPFFLFISPDICICRKKVIPLRPELQNSVIHKTTRHSQNPVTMNKEETYRTLLAQADSLTAGETDRIAKMANISAAIRETFGFWWVGFYRVADEHELVLGPFQGPVACIRIPFGKGVCGTAWKEARTLIVPDVHLFPGHIACSSASNSEIVVPVWDGDKIIAVLDIDSTDYNAFDDLDRSYLERLAALAV